MWGEFEFNAPYTGEDIIEINGVKLPQNYIDFMKEHNGGEGDIGESWLVLYPMEELQKYNDNSEISEYLPNHIIIGGDGGEELYGITTDGKYFNVPSMFEEEEVTILCDDIKDFADKVNEFWGNL
ncbi:MAG: SMI1/KNR4 family protein [Oscillospiraceae bacterium]|nr:SMI1/KNR4 family protein [Oscillospiraceae bacterium]